MQDDPSNKLTYKTTPYKLCEFIEGLITPKKMRHAILKGLPKHLRGQIWRIISRIDIIKVEMIGKHNN